MASSGWRTALVVGGVGSGSSAYAETLLGGVTARRLDVGDGSDLAELARALADAKPDETLLVDGVDAWLPAAGRGGRAAAAADDLEALATAVRACPARVVIVSAEVGLSPATTAAARSSAEAVGALNRAIAGAVDLMALVVAGQPTWLKGASPAPAGAVVAAPTAASDAAPDLANLSSLPRLDEQAREGAIERLAGAGLGALAAVGGFAAGTQGTATPAPWQTVRVLVLHGDHRGDAAAGALGSTLRAAQLREGGGSLAQLAASSGAQLHLVEAATAAAIEDEPAMSEDVTRAALAHGWQLAERAADEGVDALVLASIGDGAETAAAAVAASLGGPEADPASVLGRVRTAAGMIDDAAWILRCAAVRDALHRAGSRSRLAARAVLTELGGPDLAIATGVILGACARRTPVLLDGPVGAAAAMAARNLAAPTRRWCLIPDHGGHPTVVRASEVLGLTPLLDLTLDVGEGATTLAMLPLLRCALTLPGTPVAPPGGGATDDG